MPPNFPPNAWLIPAIIGAVGVVATVALLVIGAGVGAVIIAVGFAVVAGAFWAVGHRGSQSGPP
jgi:hypothetical protein